MDQKRGNLQVKRVSWVGSGSVFGKSAIRPSGLVPREGAVARPEPRIAPADSSINARRQGRSYFLERRLRGVICPRPLGVCEKLSAHFRQKARLVCTGTRIPVLRSVREPNHFRICGRRVKIRSAGTRAMRRSVELPCNSWRSPPRRARRERVRPPSGSSIYHAHRHDDVHGLNALSVRLYVRGGDGLASSRNPVRADDKSFGCGAHIVERVTGH
jgi:hypothetical protein